MGQPTSAYRGRVVWGIAILAYILLLSGVQSNHSAIFGHMMKNMQLTKDYVSVLRNITAQHCSASLRGLATTAKAENI